MTKEQIQQIVAIIARAYPKTYVNMNPKEKWEVVELYYTMFKDVEYEHMAAVVMEYIKTEHFPPAIADLRNLVDKLMDTSFEPSVESCINESWEAICGNKSFEELSEPSKVYWGSQRAINTVGYDENTSYTVVRGQMQRRLPDILQDLKENKLLYRMRDSLGVSDILPIGFDENGKLIKTEGNKEDAMLLGDESKSRGITS